MQIEYDPHHDVLLFLIDPHSTKISYIRALFFLPEKK